MWLKKVSIGGLGLAVICMLLSCSTTTKGSLFYSPKADIEYQIANKNLDEAVDLFAKNRNNLGNDVESIRANIKDLLLGVLQSETSNFESDLHQEAAETVPDYDFSYIDADQEDAGDFYAKITEQAKELELEESTTQGIEEAKTQVDTLVAALITREEQLIASAITSGTIPTVTVSNNFDKTKLWNDNQNDFETALHAMSLDVLLNEYPFWNGGYDEGKKLVFDLLVAKTTELMKRSSSRIAYLMRSTGGGSNAQAGQVAAGQSGGNSAQTNGFTILSPNAGTWKQRGNGRWQAWDPSGKHTSIFVVRTSPAAMANAQGVIVYRRREPNFEVFIPNPGSSQMWALWRRNNSPWNGLGEMHDVTSGSAATSVAAQGGRVPQEVLKEVIRTNLDSLLDEFGKSGTKDKVAFLNYLNINQTEMNKEPFNKLLELDLAKMIDKDHWKDFQILSESFDLKSLSSSLISQINSRSRLAKNIEMFNYKAVFDLLSKENKSLILASLLNGMPDIKSYIGFIIKNQEYLKDTGFSVPVFINDLQYSQVSVAWPFTAVNDEDAVSSKGIEITDDSASVSKVKEHRQVMVSKFVNGTRLVNNPDYRAAELNLEKAKNDLANAQAAQQENDAMAASNTSNSGLGALLSGTGKLLGTAAVDLAQSQVDAAYQKLEDTPQQIEKENVQSYSFPVTKTTYQKKLILSMMFRGIGKFGEKAATTESVSSVDISTPEGLSDTDIKFKPADFSGENDLENFENKKDTVILSSDTLPTLTFNEGQAGNKTSGGNSLLNSKLAASPAQPANHTSSVQVSGSNPGGTSDQSETSLDQPETSLDQSLSISRNTSMTTSRAFPYTGHGAEAARRLLTDVGGWPRSSPLQIAASTQRDTLIAAAVVQAWGAEAEAQQGAMQKAAQMAATMHANLKSAYSLLSVGSKPDNSGNIITETELASLADSY